MVDEAKNDEIVDMDEEIKNKLSEPEDGDTTNQGDGASKEDEVEEPANPSIEDLVK